MANLKVLSKNDPAMAKYARMEKAGLPQGAVENCMIRDGVDPKSLFGSEIVTDPNGPEPVIATGGTVINLKASPSTSGITSPKPVSKPKPSVAPPPKATAAPTPKVAPAPTPKVIAAPTPRQAEASLKQISKQPSNPSVLADTLFSSSKVSVRSGKSKKTKASKVSKAGKSSNNLNSKSANFNKFKASSTIGTQNSEFSATSLVGAPLKKFGAGVSNNRLVPPPGDRPVMPDISLSNKQQSVSTLPADKRDTAFSYGSFPDTEKNEQSSTTLNNNAGSVRRSLKQAIKSVRKTATNLLAVAKATTKTTTVVTDKFTYPPSFDSSRTPAGLPPSVAPFPVPPLVKTTTMNSAMMSRRNTGTSQNAPVPVYTGGVMRANRRPPTLYKPPPRMELPSPFPRDTSKENWGKILEETMGMDDIKSDNEAYKSAAMQVLNVTDDNMSSTTTSIPQTTMALPPKPFEPPVVKNNTMLIKLQSLEEENQKLKALEIENQLLKRQLVTRESLEATETPVFDTRQQKTASTVLAVVARPATAMLFKPQYLQSSTSIPKPPVRENTMKTAVSKFSKLTTFKPGSAVTASRMSANSKKMGAANDQQKENNMEAIDPSKRVVNGSVKSMNSSSKQLGSKSYNNLAKSTGSDDSEYNAGMSKTGSVNPKFGGGSSRSLAPSVKTSATKNISGVAIQTKPTLAQQKSMTSKPAEERTKSSANISVQNMGKFNPSAPQNAKNASSNFVEGDVSNPNFWVKKKSAEDNKEYYVNRLTGESRWELPEGAKTGSDNAYDQSDTDDDKSEEEEETKGVNKKVIAQAMVVPEVAVEVNPEANDVKPFSMSDITGDLKSGLKHVTTASKPKPNLMTSMKSLAATVVKPELKINLKPKTMADVKPELKTSMKPMKINDAKGEAVTASKIMTKAMTNIPPMPSMEAPAKSANNGQQRESAASKGSSTSSRSSTSSNESWGTTGFVQVDKFVL